MAGSRPADHQNCVVGQTIVAHKSFFLDVGLFLTYTEGFRGDPPKQRNGCPPVSQPQLVSPPLRGPISTVYTPQFLNVMFWLG